MPNRSQTEELGTMLSNSDTCFVRMDLALSASPGVSNSDNTTIDLRKASKQSSILCGRQTMQRMSSEQSELRGFNSSNGNSKACA
mgnify:CR=1 FL=1